MFFCLAIVALVVVGCGEDNLGFSGLRSLRHAEKLCGFGPRPVGSDAIARASDYIGRVLERNAWTVEYQDFAHRGQRVRNVLGKRGSGPLVILACHYDTRPLADRDPADRSQPVLGANDGASGAAVLLELARVLDQEATSGYQVWLAFLGAEESGEINNWEWSVGGNRLAAKLVGSKAQRPQWVMVLNMVGDKDQSLHYEWNSALWIQEELWYSGETLGYADVFVTEFKYAIDEGSHTAFLRWGIPAALVGDFDYPYWRTRLDTPDKLSSDSLERVGRALEHMLEGEQSATHAGDRSDTIFNRRARP